MSKLVDTLVISGGGSKSISVIGTLKYLEDNNILKNIKRYAGSSAGSIISLMLNIGYTPDEIKTTFFAQDSSMIHDPFYSKLWNLINYYGINSGNKIVSYISKLMSDKGFHRDITFMELKLLTDKILVVTGTSLTDQNTYYFNYSSTPKMKVIDAIRISISIPIFFTSVTYNINDSDHVFIDGGILENFPMFYFETCDSLNKYVLTSNELHRLKSKSNQEPSIEVNTYTNILGIMLFLDGETRDVDDFDNNTVVINGLLSFLSSYINTMLLKIEIDGFRSVINNSNNAFFDRVISINIPKTVSYTDFDLKDDVKETLITNGKLAAESFFG
jgi:NTE family protein